MPDNLVFAGTPGFALASLRALVEAGMAPVAVLTQPDRRSGRGQKVVPGPVKRYATLQGIPLWQPRTLKDEHLHRDLAELRPRAIIVAAYGLIFPPGILELPEKGCINVHASLLPRWRGAAPVQAAILHGDRETGISLMRMEQGLDTGPVLASESLTIGEMETAGLLQDRLATLGGELLVRHLPRFLQGSVAPIEQDESRATYAGKLTSADAQLDWEAPARQVWRSVRAYDPEPGAWFLWRGEKVKCWAAEPLASPDCDAPPGTVVAAGREGIDVACGEGVLRLLRVQRPGRTRISAFEFASQQALSGERLSV